MNATVQFDWKHLYHLLAALALATALPAAFASPASALPPEHHAGAVAYVSGGIGEDEANAMKHAAARYPLEVEMLKKAAGSGAEYSANDRVVIRDQQGKTVLDTQADGPFLLVRLTPGRYRISATDGGMTRNSQVHIAANAHEHVVFEW